MHPAAAGYLRGIRQPVAVIAETAGAQVGSVNLQWPFHVPGSHRHEGSFVTVLNGLTGQYLYSQLYPGQVTQLAIAGGKLIVGEETGDPSGTQLGAWRSTTQVRALSFHRSGSGLAAQTAWTYSTGAPWASPLMSDLDAGVQTEVDGQRAFILGSQSGGVYAVAASDFSHVLWQADAGGPVHQLALATPVRGAPPVLVAAATNRVDVLTVSTGAIRVSRSYPGQYVWNVAVGRIGPHRAAVAVATDRLSTFDAATGHPIWTYRPPVASYFSNAAIVGEVTVAEYQNQVRQHAQPTTMAAVGIGPDGKVTWTAPASAATTSHAVLWNGVFASPVIPGGGADGVAFAWQDTSGAGEVDVRNAVTGALIYSNASDDLSGQRGWVIDPPVGLLSVGNNTVLIQPGGPTGLPGLSGTGSAVVDSAGTPVFLLADNQINAYPAATIRGLQGQPAAGNNTFMPGTLIPAGPAAGGQVLALPEDLTGWLVVTQAEEGVFQFPFGLTDELGADLLTVTGTPSTAGPARPKAPPTHRARPANLTVGTPTHPAGHGHRGAATRPARATLHTGGHPDTGADRARRLRPGNDRVLPRALR